MTFDRLVGLNLKDEKTYQEYRDAMAPLLKDHGGYFRYDFKIEKVLKSEANHNINRVFILCFPDKSASDKFFSNKDYKIIKSKYFEPSVQDTTVISEYER